MISLSMPLYAATMKFPEEYVTGNPGTTTIKTGTTGAPGVGNSKKYTSVHKAKFSNVFKVIVDILKEDIKVACALCGSDKIYTEINEKPIVFHNGELSTKESLSPTDTVAASIVYFMINPDSEFEEFQDAAKKIYNDIKSSGKANYEDALLLCDSFYYTAKQKLAQDPATGSPSFAEGEQLSEESIKEMGRFFTPNIANSFPANTTVFTSIDFKEKTTGTKFDKTIKVDIISRCKTGEFVLPYEWNNDDKALIPPLSFLDLYIPSEDFEDALITMHRAGTKIIQNMDMGKTGEDAIGNYGKCFAFIGKPGTGKSTMSKALCAALGIPYYPCTTTRYSEEDEYQGKLKISSGSDDTSTAAYSGSSNAFKFCETPFLKGFENGGMVVLEEFNLADPGMLMGAIGQAIEKPFIIEKDGYLPTVRHPLCMICVTCNIGTQGSQMPSEALFSRTPHVFEIDDPADEQFVKILAKQTEEVSEKQIKTVYTTYRKVLDWLKTENMPELIKVLTLRHCLAALDQIAAGISTKKALLRTLVNPLKVYAPDVAEDIKIGIIDIIK